jgi:hypothetical protein
MRAEEYLPSNAFLFQSEGAWESVNGNPDVYIFRGYDGQYYLLAYAYDKEYERGSFSCYEIDSDEDGSYVHMGMKRYRMGPEQSPYGLFIAGWGSYMKC